jgi:hypothetical protein
MINFKFKSDFRDKKLEKLAKRLEERMDKAYNIIGNNVRQKAKKGIRLGTKTRPHSDPGKTAKSRKTDPVYKNTIRYHYDKRKKSLVVGPITRGFYNRKDGAKPTKSTVPNLLEYGGYIRASNITYIRKENADPRAATIAWKKQRAAWRNIPKYKRPPDPSDPTKTKRFIKKRDFKWVSIPAGTRKVEQRPTMRLAFNKTVNQKGMRKHFLAIGAQLASDGTLKSQLKTIGPTF